MKKRWMLRSQRFARLAALAVLSALSLVRSPLAVSQTTPGAVDAVPPNPAAILEAAFANQYDVDTTSTIDLVIRNRSGQERRRRFEAASKMIDDRRHSIGRLTSPEHLRGMTILQIEAKGRGHDAFVYLPSMRSVRRITTAQRGDAFFGTDVTYEDLERRRAADFEILAMRLSSIEGEEAFEIRARPREPLTYHEVLFSIAKSDDVLLEARYFKRGATEPFRLIKAPRSSMREGDGHKLPTRLVVENFSRGTVTEVSYRNLAINPQIDDRIFSIRTLEQRREILDDAGARP